MDPYSFRDQVARVRSRSRAAVSERLVLQLNDLATPFSKGCGGVGEGHLTTHFLLDQQILLPNRLHVCNKDAISYIINVKFSFLYMLGKFNFRPLFLRVPMNEY